MEVAVILSTTDNHIQTGSLQYGVFINDYAWQCTANFNMQCGDLRSVGNQTIITPSYINTSLIRYMKLK